MTGWFSRRGFLGAAGGALAALWIASGCRPRDEAPVASAPAAGGYVDHEGWMLTADDRQKLLAGSAEPAAAP